MHRYTAGQVASVFLVTSGVALTTFSASRHTVRSASAPHESPPHVYATGIAILALALLLSGFLGLVQEKTYAHHAQRPSEERGAAQGLPDAWKESMFYLHFLALPMFLVSKADLVTQLNVLLASPAIVMRLPSPSPSVPLHALSLPELRIPSALLQLLLNTLTQLLCV